LFKLRIGNVKMGKEGGLYLSKMLKENKTLGVLRVCIDYLFKYVDSNELESEGTNHIVNSLIENKALTLLDLSSILPYPCRVKWNKCEFSKEPL